MIDSEPVIFNYISNYVKGIYGESFPIASEYKESFPKFPVAVATEIDNSVYERMRTRTIENAQKVTWEINVFSNLVGSGKFQAREIMAVFDKAFAEIGFTRTMMTPAPNYQDQNIYRIVVRYSGVVDKDLWIYTE